MRRFFYKFTRIFQNRPCEDFGYPAGRTSSNAAVFLLAIQTALLLPPVSKPALLRFIIKSRISPFKSSTSSKQFQEFISAALETKLNLRERR